jgi:uncharacterized protein
MALRFEWDGAKARSNWEKHSVWFEEAATIFGDPLSLTVSDPDHSETEERYISIGTSAASRVLVVSHTDRGDVIRLISARPATPRERRTYEEGQES